MSITQVRGIVADENVSYDDLTGIPNVTIQNPTFRIFGDSITSQNDSTSKAASGGTTMAITKYPYWWNMACWLSGNQINNQSTLSVVDNLRYGSNSGVSGADMDDIYTNTPSYASILSSMPESHLIFVIGTNDINNGTSLATLNANFVKITTQCIAANKVPIWTTVLPRNSVDGANDWSNTAGGTTTAQKRLTMVSHNQYRMDYCRDNNILISDWHTVFGDASGNAITGYTVDGLHPSGKGSYYMAKKLLDDLDGLLPQSTTSFNAYDVYDATYNPYGNILNGSLSGTGGNISSGSGTGTVTGTVPDNFQLQKSTSTTTDCFSEIVPRSDGVPGNVLQLTFTSYGTGNVSENWRFNYWNGSSTSLSSWGTSGDYIEMDVEIEYVAGHGGVGKSAGCRIGNSGATTRTATTISFNATDNTINDSGNGFGSFVSNRLAVVSGTTSNNSVFKIITAAAGKLTIDPSTPVVTEAAGASVSVSIPAMSSVSLGASTTSIPDEDTPIIYNKAPVMMIPYTGNLVPRIDIYVNGTIAGIYKIRIARPRLRKIPFASSLLSYQADN